MNNIARKGVLLSLFLIAVAAAIVTSFAQKKAPAKKSATLNDHAVVHIQKCAILDNHKNVGRDVRFEVDDDSQVAIHFDDPDLMVQGNAVQFADTYQTPIFSLSNPPGNGAPSKQYTYWITYNADDCSNLLGLITSKKGKFKIQVDAQSDPNEITVP